MINDKRLVFFPKQGTVRGSHGFSMLSSGVICLALMCVKMTKEHEQMCQDVG